MSKLNLTQVYSGFTVNKETFVKELNANVYTLEHTKTGARLLYVDSTDDNKVFSISFRTPPSDSTGVFHILEHSVLCGSRKFNVKEPFVELLKGSMNTFLNALTFADKTMYPVASRNEKDFMNLMDVYMDAVFNPNIREHDEIFRQEGWHYEINETTDELIYKGVVFNEMKGVFSSPDTILANTINESIFPDNPYRHVSGGDPEKITDLTYDGFMEAYYTYYHPSNSYIFLYGNLNVEETLAFLDRDYLTKYDKKQIDSSIPLQQPVQKHTVVKEYEVLETDTVENKVHMALNFVIGEHSDRERAVASQILQEILLTSPAAPLKKALLARGIGQHVSGMFNSALRQPVFSIIVRNAHEGQEEEFKLAVIEELTRIVEEGIDKKLIEGAISGSEFQLREADFSMPKGLVYNLFVMDNWLYDGRPEDCLAYEKLFEQIKLALTTNYFEQLIEEIILNSKHNSFAVVKPSRTLGEQKRQAELNKLKTYQNSLRTEELDQLQKETEKLIQRQSTRDTKEDLEQIPMLTLSDLNQSPERIPCTDVKVNGIDTLWHEMNTSKIAHYNLYFDIKNVVRELGESYIPYVSLLSKLLGKVDTRNYNYNELSNEISIKFGGLDFSNKTFENSNEENLNVRLRARAKVLEPHLEVSFHYLNEIINHSLFTDEKRILELLQEIKLNLEMSLNQNGHSFALMRVHSQLSHAAKYEENLDGINFYRFICSILKDFDQNQESILEALEKTRQHVFTKTNLVLSFTGDQALFNVFSEFLPRLELNDLTKNHKVQPTEISDTTEENEAYVISSGVSYVTKGYQYQTLGYEYSGKLKVLKRILDLNYLWNAVRVKGGAYGVGMMISRWGVCSFFSYRDPNVAATFNVYDHAYEHLADFNEDQQTMTKYIIGTIAGQDRPLSDREKGEQSDAYYFSNISFADLEKERREILSTTAEDIQGYAKLLEEIVAQGRSCVIGNKDKINENKEVFDVVTDLIS
ncbi:insulinase family protein [Bacillales bacterium AN1005]